MLEKIIKVEPTDVMISVTWMIGSRCNYDCMYCPADLHDMTSQQPSFEKLKQAWQNIYDKTQHLKLPYKINFTGGEVTANRSFLPLVRYLRNGKFNIKQVVVTTNGSASVNYYTRLASMIDSISFSTHSEFFNELEFFKKVYEIDQLMIRPEKSLHVNIMDEHWNQDRIPLYVSWLKKHNISYSINIIDYRQQTRVEIMKKGKQNIEQL